MIFVLKKNKKPEAERACVRLWWPRPCPGEWSRNRHDVALGALSTTVANAVIGFSSERGLQS